MESVDDGSQMRVSATGGLFDGFTYDQTAAEATRLDGGDAEFDILEGGSFDEGAPAGGGGGGAGGPSAPPPIGGLGGVDDGLDDYE